MRMLNYVVTLGEAPSTSAAPRHSGSLILVVRLGAMGDIIHALPAVASLKHSFPGSQVTWAVEPRWAPLLEGNPFVDRVLLLDRRTRRGSGARLARVARGALRFRGGFPGSDQVRAGGLRGAHGADLRLRSIARAGAAGRALLFR